jgi:hypothetical protein
VRGIDSFLLLIRYEKILPSYPPYGTGKRARKLIAIFGGNGLLIGIYIVL